MQLYVYYIRRRVRGYDALLTSDGNIQKINMRLLDVALRLASNDSQRRTAVEKTIKYTTLHNMETLALTLTRAINNIYLPGGSVLLASHLLQKVNTFRPNLFYKFALYLRYRDLEIFIGETNNKKRIYALLNNAHEVKKELQLYVTLFFKGIVSMNIDKAQLSSFAYSAYLAEKECSRIMDSLLKQYPKDVAVVRNYAKFIEDIKQDHELAREYYEEASSLEDQEQERARYKRKLLAHLEREENQDIDAAKNAIIPLRHTQETSSEYNEDEYQIGKITKRAKGVKIHTGSVIGSVSNSSSAKKQDIYRKKLANKDNKWGLRFAISSIGFALALIGAVVVIVSYTSMTYVPTSYLVDSCKISGYPYETLTMWRNYQYQNIILKNASFYLPNVVAPLLASSKDVSDSALSTRMSNARNTLYTVSTIRIALPVITSANVSTVVSNVTRYDASKLYITTVLTYRCTVSKSSSFSSQ